MSDKKSWNMMLFLGCEIFHRLPIRECCDFRCSLSHHRSPICFEAEVSPLLLFLLPLLALLSVIFLLAPSSGVVGGSALQSRAEVPKLEGCLSLLLRVWDSTTPCSLGGVSLCELHSLLSSRSLFLFSIPIFLLSSD